MRVIAAALFACFWAAIHVTWAGMLWLGTLMANDSGSSTSGQQMALIGGVFGGLILTGMAAFPATWVILRPENRIRKLKIFGALLGAGLLLQLFAWGSFLAG